MESFIVVGSITKEVLYETDDHNKAIDWIASNFDPSRWVDLSIYQRILKPKSEGEEI